MKVITPVLDILVKTSDQGQVRTLPSTLQYVVPDGFIDILQKSLGNKSITIDDFMPTNMYNGEDLNGKTLTCFRTGGIGDLLFITTTLHELKRRYPEAKIFLGCNPEFGTILQSADYRLVELPMKKSNLDASDYIMIFEGMIEGSAEAETVHAYDIVRNKFKLDSLATYKPVVHIDEEVKTHVAEYIKMVKDYTSIEDKKIVVIQLFSSVPKRSAKEELILQLMDKLPENYNFIIIGSPSQQPQIEHFVTAAWQKVPKRVFCGSQMLPSLMEAAALISMTDLVIGPDSAVLHMAGAFDKPMIGLFGPFPSKLRLSYYKNAIGIDANSKCQFARGEYNACFEHGEGTCSLAKKVLQFYSPCLELIKVDDILEAMKRLGFAI